jgi:adenine-specific DNA-methyltransferase
VFVLTRAERRALGLSPDEERLLRPFHPARQVRRYAADPEVAYEILYLTARTCPDLAPYPNVQRHLAPFLPLLKMRRETQLGMRAYFHLHWPRDEAIFLSPKILCRRQASRPLFALSEGPYFVDLALNIIRPRAGGPDLYALLALLNSAPAHFWFYHRGKRKGELLQLDGAPLGALPIPPLSAGEEAALAALGRRLSALHQGGGAAALIRDAEDEVDALAARGYGLGGTCPSLLREPWALDRLA